MVLLSTVLWTVCAFQGLVIYVLWRRVAEVQQLLATVDVPVVTSLAAGSLSPQFDTVTEPSGERLTLDALLGSGGVLLFLSSHCDACGRLISSLAVAGALPVRTIVFWTGELNDDAKRLSLIADVAVRDVPRISAAFGVSHVPAAVSVTRDGVIAKIMLPKRHEDIVSLSEGLDRERARSVPRTVPSSATQSTTQEMSDPHALAT